MPAKLFFTFALTAFIASFSLHADEQQLERELKQVSEQISYHILIKNYSMAERLAQNAFKNQPKSLQLYKLYLEALAMNGSEKPLLRLWQQFSHDFPEARYDDDVLEFLAKGVLHHAEIAEPYLSKLYRYAVADSYSDASSVEMLTEALQDSNYAVRDMALTAVLSHGDDQLCEQVKSLINREDLPAVKVKALQVLLRIQGEKAIHLIEHYLKDDDLSHLDKLELIVAKLSTKESIESKELVKLAHSEFYIERLIAAYAFGYFGHMQDEAILLALIQDTITDVKIQALTSLGLLRKTSLDGQDLSSVLFSATQSDNSEVRLIANWVLALNHDKDAMQSLNDFMFHADPKVRLHATSLIGYSLPMTQALALHHFHNNTDPFVKLNLAVSLLLNRQEMELASDAVFKFLSQPQSVLFKTSFLESMELIWPSSLLTDQERMQGVSSLITQTELVHFCLLNLMAVIQDPRAIDATARFLETHHSNAALSSIPRFLRTSSGPLLNILHSFYQDEDVYKRIHSAAIVATLKKEDKALEVLHSAYSEVDRSAKELILRIVGEIGSKDSIEFLSNALYEPSNSLRVVAASSLMRCVRN